MDENDLFIKNRVLCSDETCIGLVDSDGLCKVCGKIYEGDEDLPSAESGFSEIEATDQSLNEDGSRFEQAPLEDETAPDPNERICCPDETCVGIIGPDGRCGTCQKTL